MTEFLLVASYAGGARTPASGRETPGTGAGHVSESVPVQRAGLPRRPTFPLIDQGPETPAQVSGRFQVTKGARRCLHT